jgi:AraC family transcriptional regulator
VFTWVAGARENHEKKVPAPQRAAGDLSLGPTDREIARRVKPARAAWDTFHDVKSETRSFYESAVERTAAHIVANLDEALDLAAMARAAALSPFHFHRVFRGMLGETPLEMHRRLRLERAATQLLSSQTPITTIAFDAGYETHEAFTRVFHEAYGASPSAFRRSAVDPGPGCARPRQVELAAPSSIHFDRTIHHPIQFLGGDIAMDVTIENMPELRVATVHHVGPYPRISEAFQRLGAIAGPGGLLRFPETAMLAIYHDDPETTPVEQLQSDAGVTVPSGVPLPEGLAELRLPGGRYAKMTHVGPYTELGDAWARLMGEWLPKSGHRVGGGSSYEVYRNTPENAAPNELRTDLYLPIA